MVFFSSVDVHQGVSFTSLGPPPQMSRDQRGRRWLKGKERKRQASLRCGRAHPWSRVLIQLQSQASGSLLVCSSVWVWLSPSRRVRIISVWTHLPQNSMLLSLMKIPLSGLKLWYHKAPHGDSFSGEAGFSPALPEIISFSLLAALTEVSLTPLT